MSNKLSKAIANLSGDSEPSHQEIEAQLTDRMNGGTGDASVAGRPGYAWALVGDAPTQIRAPGVIPVDSLPVTLHRNSTAGMFQVKEVNYGAIEGWDGTTFDKAHGEQHNIDGGDPTYIDQRQLLIGLLRAQDTPDGTVIAGPVYYQHNGLIVAFPETDTDDLIASHLPSVSGNSRLVLVSIDSATNTLQYTNGSEFIANFVSPEDYFSSVPVGAVVLGDVRLESDSTTVTQDMIDGRRRAFLQSTIAQAPADADYLVKTANATLTAERVVTDTTSIVWDWATGGQAKATRAALTGDATASAGSNAVTVVQASGAFALTGDISPTQIVANTNDYNPTGLSTAAVLRLSTDASRNITGLVGGADGRLIIIHNVGSFDIVLKDESASSTAGNRFALTADVTLTPDSVAIIQYDSTSSRWRCLSSGSSGSSGTVTSVALTATPTGIFDVSGSPVTTSGTLALSMDNQNANTVLAGPASGSATTPAFRALVRADLPSGSVIQRVNTQTGAVATGTTTVPIDDTIPQNTEGDEYMTLAITPTSSSNLLRIQSVFNGSSSVVNNLIVSLFQDSTANALISGNARADVATGLYQVVLNYVMTAGTTSSTTFKIRCGGNAAGTTTFNGTSGGRLFGGVLLSSITIMETVP